MADDAKRTRPIEFYRKFLEQDVRPDGRELGEIRPTIINVGSISTAEGSALVKLGNTTVICGIKAELSSPTVEAPNQGFIVPNVELPPLCSARFKSGPPGEQAQVISQLVFDIVKDCACVKLEDLCIRKNKWCWVLYCDMLCLDYDGNVVDACLMALVAALKNASLPSVEVDEDGEIIKTDQKVRLPLNLQCHPVATTFAIFDDHIIFADPTNEEEQLATGVITIVTTEDNICSVHKPGGSPISEEKLQDCITRTIQQGKNVRKLIDETVNSVER